MRPAAATILFATLLTAQPSQPTFEVASIKPSTSQSVRGSDGGPGSRDPGRYLFGKATALDLIIVAFGVDPFQVSSKMSLTSEQFDLDAKLPPAVTKEDFRAMMRTLLAERFHLKAHTESREFAGYELVVAKTGLKLNDPQSQPKSDGFPVLAPNRPGLTSSMRAVDGSILVRTRAQQQTMAAFARSIRPPAGEPVVDRTGLTGKYDFLVEYTFELPGAHNESGGPGPDVFQALPLQLGLQLVPKKIPFEVVVVESIDKLPTVN